jgi:hypothetical protein
MNANLLPIIRNSFRPGPSNANAAPRTQGPPLPSKEEAAEREKQQRLAAPEQAHQRQGLGQWAIIIVLEFYNK